MATAASATAAATAEKPPVEAGRSVDLPILRFPPESPLTDELLAQLSSLNSPWHFERTPEGTLQIMAPAAPDADHFGYEVMWVVGQWAHTLAGGRTHGSSPGFTMPDGSVLSPDGAWISDERLASLLPLGQGRGFPSVVPDLIVEVRSPSDELPKQQEKMERWIGYGARLGWLFDPSEDRLYVYRPNIAPEVLERPDRISGEPEFPGLEIDLSEIWW